MTHMLMGLAQGKVVLVLEGGYNTATISDCVYKCARALLKLPLEVAKPVK
jgi:histone deacetylase 6